MPDAAARRPPRAAIFDLDGVLVDTAICHFEAWRRLARDLGFELAPEVNERVKGVSRARSLEIVLEAGGIAASRAERERLATLKNDWYVESISTLDGSAVLPGVRETLETLRAGGIKLAVGSGSENASALLDRIGIRAYFDAVVDGKHATRAKPDPEVFLLAARALGVEPRECVVFEDAQAGVEAARAAGMAAVGIGDPAFLHGADQVVRSLAELDVFAVFGVGRP